MSPPDVTREHASVAEIRADLRALHVGLERVESSLRVFGETMAAKQGELLRHMDGMEQRLSARLITIEHIVRQQTEEIRDIRRDVREMNQDVREMNQDVREMNLKLGERGSS